MVTTTTSATTAKETGSVKKERTYSHPREKVWKAITDSDALAQWMFPNDFKPQVGHTFTFQVPPNPQAGFDGIVRGEVLEVDPPNKLVYKWSVPGLETQVNISLEEEGTGTRIYFEQSGFDLTQPWSKQAIGGAEYGWNMMLEKLDNMLANK